ncbi:hypothetical protein B0T18DRAFT_472506, partial [Schizothecium vesticola]
GLPHRLHRRRNPPPRRHLPRPRLALAHAPLPIRPSPRPGRAAQHRRARLARPGPARPLPAPSPRGAPPPRHRRKRHRGRQGPVERRDRGRRALGADARLGGVGAGRDRGGARGGEANWGGGGAGGGEVQHLGEGVKQLGEEVKGVVERGVEKGRDIVGRARARAQLGEERLEAKMDAKVLHVSDVERALAERFEKRAEDTRSVEEVLAGRYRPIGERDHSRLRGV